MNTTPTLAIEKPEAGKSNGCPTDGCNGLVTTQMDQANRQTCTVCLGCGRKYNCKSWDG